MGDIRDRRQKNQNKNHTVCPSWCMPCQRFHWSVSNWMNWMFAGTT